MSTKGKKTGTPNYKNDMLLNCIDIILPAGPEGWKTVASRYQIVSGEAGLRFYDDVRRHFFTKLCKNGKRQTGLNNKSAPLPQVARAQDIYRKMLSNERVGGENENDDDDDDDEDEEGIDDENDDEDMMQADNAVPAIPLTTPPADIDSATELPPKKKIKHEYEGEKTKNSKPNNSRGGIAATISNLCNGITEVAK